MPKRKSKTLFSAKQKKKKEKRKPPTKPKNKSVRAREYLTPEEIKKLIKAAKLSPRHALRDSTLILLMFRHALRVGEIITLTWDQIDLKKKMLHVQRLKNGLPAVHPLRTIELRALRQLQRETAELERDAVFVSERGLPLSERTVHAIIAAAGKNAGFRFSIHPHMLRHSTGFYLANKGIDTRAIQAYLGHANINHTVKYTELTPQRFKDFWKD